jgi:hypothetical protein
MDPAQRHSLGMSTMHMPLGTSWIHHSASSAAAPRNRAPNREVALQDLATAAVRIAWGALLAACGGMLLAPLLARVLDTDQVVRWDGVWFDLAMALALTASGTLLTTRKAVPLAWTLLVPVSMHLVFQWMLVGHLH